MARKPVKGSEAPEPDAAALEAAGVLASVEGSEAPEPGEVFSVSGTFAPEGESLLSNSPLTPPWSPEGLSPDAD
jgi:hypothetical protein